MHIMNKNNKSNKSNKTHIRRSGRGRVTYGHFVIFVRFVSFILLSCCAAIRGALTAMMPASGAAIHPQLGI